jgi:hypothetical protein
MSSKRKTDSTEQPPLDPAIAAFVDALARDLAREDHEAGEQAKSSGVKEKKSSAPKGSGAA